MHQHARRRALTPLVIATLGLSPILLPTLARAQESVPQQIHVSVVPATPGIRSVFINKQYHPIVSKDDTGVMVSSTAESAHPHPVECRANFEVTLDNSRVLYRTFDICAAKGSVVVDVAQGNAPPQSPEALAEQTNRTGNAPSTTNNSLSTDSRETAAAAASSTSSSQGQASAQGTTGAPGSQAQTSSNGLGTAKEILSLSVKDANNAGAAPDNTTAGNGTPSGDGQLPALGNQALQPGDDAQAADAQTTTRSLPIFSQTAIDSAEWATSGTDYGATMTKLTHADPNSGQADFTASCTPQSGMVTIDLGVTGASPNRANPIPVELIADDFSTTYNATIATIDGQPHLVINLSGTDALWAALAQKNNLEIQVEGAQPLTVSLSGSAKPVKLFASTCTQQQEILGAMQQPGQLEPQLQMPPSDASCADLGRIRSYESDEKGKIVFRNNSRQALDVSWIDYNGNPRHYATLQPGQILNQDTFRNNAWLVSDNANACLGIYTTRELSRQINMTSPAPTQPQQVPDQMQGQGVQQPFSNQNQMQPDVNGWSGQSQGQQQRQSSAQMNSPASSSAQQPYSSNLGFHTGGQSGAQYGAQSGSQATSSAQVQQDSFQSQSNNGLMGRQVSFMCTDGIDLNVTFTRAGREAVVEEGGQFPVTLSKSGENGSAVYYSNSESMLSLQGDNASWRRPGLENSYCVGAQGPTN